MAGGRPTLYTPEMCQKLIDIRKTGKSVTKFCAEVGIHKDTLYEWRKIYPEFSDAFKLAKMYAQDAWEDRLEVMMLDKTVNSPLVKLYFANVFDWHDKTEERIDATISDSKQKIRETLNHLHAK